MKIKIDKNGCVHIPKIMRQNIGIKNGQELNVECKNDRIIITSDKQMRTREEIKKFLSDIQEFDDDISKGMRAMAEWVLYEDIIEKEEEND